MSKPATASRLASRIFTSLELIGAVNVTHRQLQWWDERDLITPRICEHKRLYAWTQALEVCIVLELRRKGLSMPKIRRVIGLLRTRLKRLHNSTDVYLLTDGCYVDLAEADELPQVLCQAPRPLVVVSLRGLEERLAAIA